MMYPNEELAEYYLSECREHLDTMETELLAIENGGAQVNDQSFARVFRAVHSVKGGASFFDLSKIEQLAHLTEEALALIRSGDLPASPDSVGVLLRATDNLDELIRYPEKSNQADISVAAAALESLIALRPGCGVTPDAPEPVARVRASGPLRMLLVEDDFASRLLLQTFLSRYGECHIAVNGREAVAAFRAASESGQGYDLVCMDIMMPEMDGREAVRQVRALERARQVPSTAAAKIIMTTTVSDIKAVIQCFHELCNAYLMKPIDLSRLLDQMKSYHLVQ